MPKNHKPWLTYGLGDGRDKVVHKQKKIPRKYSRAVLFLLFLGGVGGHRWYMLQPWAAVRMIFAPFIISVLVIALLLTGVFGEFSEEKYTLLFLILWLGVYIVEFRSIRPGVERVNKMIEVANAKDKV